MAIPRRGLTIMLWAFLTCLALSGNGWCAAATDFTASVHSLTDAEKDKMKGRSWHEGCPVPLDDLAAIQLSYLGYDGDVHEGVLVIQKRLADEVIAMFRELFDAKFRIERMQPYEDFPVGEYAEHNDTVGFYCRPAQDNPSIFSWHAYGLAVDLNPLTNPYHDPKEGWWPKGSESQSNRNREAAGLLTAKSPAVATFLHHGWAWGGIYHDPDYMHFGKVTLGDESNPVNRPLWAERLQYAPN